MSSSLLATTTTERAAGKSLRGSARIFRFARHPAHVAVIASPEPFAQLIALMVEGRGRNNADLLKALEQDSVFYSARVRGRVIGPLSWLATHL